MPTTFKGSWHGHFKGHHPWGLIDWFDRCIFCYYPRNLVHWACFSWLFILIKSCWNWSWESKWSLEPHLGLEGVEDIVNFDSLTFPIITTFITNFLLSSHTFWIVVTWWYVLGDWSFLIINDYFYFQKKSVGNSKVVSNDIMALEVFSSIRYFLKPEEISIDNWIFKLHYRFSVALLLGSSGM